MRRALYFGLDPSRYSFEGEVVHLPLIRTEPLPFELVRSYLEMPHSHVLFTSRAAVTYYFAYVSNRSKRYLCVGEATAERLADFGATAEAVAEKEQGEGVIELLETLDTEHILYPHSVRARRLLPDYLRTRGTPFVLYETHLNTVELPDPSLFDRLVFTSPSTVEAFAACMRLPPRREQCVAIGPITQNALNKFFDSTIVKLHIHK